MKQVPGLHLGRSPQWRALPTKDARTFSNGQAISTHNDRFPSVASQKKIRQYESAGDRSSTIFSRFIMMSENAAEILNPFCHGILRADASEPEFSLQSAVGNTYCHVVCALKYHPDANFNYHSNL